MNKIMWARMMVGQIGQHREFGYFRIVSWVNTDQYTTTDLITFIIESELGLPGHLIKRCLKKYDQMTENDIKRDFIFKGGTKDYPSEEDFIATELDRNHFKQQIEEHKR
jgi:hypothetical protein